MYLAVTVIAYGQTLTVHPAVTALIQSSSDQHNDWTDKYFLPVTCFLIQAVFDWIGRSIATLSQWPKLGTFSEWFLLVLVLLRTGFLPLIMRCNVLPGLLSALLFTWKCFNWRYWFIDLVILVIIKFQMIGLRRFCFLMTGLLLQFLQHLTYLVDISATLL